MIGGFLARVRFVLAFFLLISGATSGQSEKAPVADTLVLHGKVYTLDSKQPWAQAVAVQRGKIVAVGSDTEIDAHMIAATKVVTTMVGGRVVYQSNAK
jgi:predicted amidohydrolase YtcJ